MQMRRFFATQRKTTRVLFFILLLINVATIMAACGKLTNDSDRPDSPSGSSGGQKIPMALPDELGSYKITLRADDIEIPADGISYTTLHGRLYDSSGKSVEHFIIHFETLQASSDGIGRFSLPPDVTGGAQTLVQEIDGRTQKSGKVSVRFYGVQSGSCVVQASVDVDGKGKYIEGDLFKTISILITGGPGVPGPGIAGVYLSADSTSKTQNVGTCGSSTCSSIDFLLTATVWDENGELAGAGTRVEFYDSSGDIIGYGHTSGNGTVTTTVLAEPPCPLSAGGASWSFTVTAEVYINNVQYTDEITLTANAECSLPTITVTADPATLDLDGSGSIFQSTITACSSLGSSGVDIDFSLSSTAIPGDNLSVTSATTDATGCVTTTYSVPGTAVPLGLSETATITATGSDPQHASSESVEITVNGPTP